MPYACHYKGKLMPYACHYKGKLMPYACHYKGMILFYLSVDCLQLDILLSPPQ